MKKTLVVISLVLVLAFLISGCSLFDPKVPVDCGGETKKVKLEDVAAYKEACDLASGKVSNVDNNIADNCDCNCDTPVAQPAVVVEKQPETVVVATALECSYDYSVMPTGRDSEGRPLADHGISYPGSIIGPALVQLDSLTVVSVFPSEVYVVPENSTTWKYIGDSSCLISQYKSFPGKNIIRISN